MVIRLAETRRSNKVRCCIY